MSFKPSAFGSTFALPVTANIPDTKGRLMKVSFELICNRLDREEVLEMWKAIQPPPLFPKAVPAVDADIVDTAAEADSTVDVATADEPERKQMTDDEVIEKILVGFGKGLIDENDQPMQFTPENREAVFSVHPITMRAVACFFDYYMKAGQKN